ncbi:MAG: cell envelope integrity protein TolA, partial [Holosporaceae bacterium]|nr:cell envelope integrity protein TolA [Holosporaceae bacterium]
MLRNKKDKSHFTKFSVYSAALHGSVLLCCAISLHLPRQTPRLLVDVDIVGDGELQGYIEKYSQQQMSLHSSPAPSEPSAADNRLDSDENNSINEPLPENPERQEELKEMPQETQEEAPEKTSEKEPEPVTDADNPDDNEANKAPLANENPDEEPVPREESKQDAEEKKKKELERQKLEQQKKLEEKKKLEQQKKKEEQENKKKKKDKAKKELINIISKAEKVKKKNESKKKLQNIAQQMSEQNKIQERNKSDRAFGKMIGDSIKNLGIGGGGNGAGRNGGGRSGSGGYGRFGSGAGTGNGLSEGEYNMISAQINPHWVIPSGIRGADSLIIEIRIKLKENGEVIPSELTV